MLFVTHDIEEAVKMGDRVASSPQGGRLAQYDTPAAVLGAPADEFVAEFVGGRPRRCGGWRSPRSTRPGSNRSTGWPPPSWPAPSRSAATLEDALALLLREDKAMIGVTDGPKFLGVLTPNGIHAMLRADVNR